jgi:prepilin-type N-terminal cleavage/methylation domain-containing protein
VKQARLDNYRAPAGFTLIEMMLAIAVLALILVMLAGSFHAVATSKVQAEDHIAVDSAARAIVTGMVKEIRGAVQTPNLPSRVLLMGGVNAHGGQVIDSIAVSTLTPGHRRALEDFGPEDTVSYTATPNREHRGLFMLLRSQNSSLLGIGTGDNVRGAALLAANLLSLRIHYFDGSNWSESWNSQSLPPGRQLPTEVAIELTLASRSGAPVSIATMVTLPMAYLQW